MVIFFLMPVGHAEGMRPVHPHTIVFKLLLLILAAAPIASYHPMVLRGRAVLTFCNLLPRAPPLLSQKELNLETRFLSLKN